MRRMVKEQQARLPRAFGWQKVHLVRWHAIGGRIQKYNRTLGVILLRGPRTKDSLDQLWIIVVTRYDHDWHVR